MTVKRAVKNRSDRQCPKLEAHSTFKQICERLKRLRKESWFHNHRNRGTIGFESLQNLKIECVNCCCLILATEWIE